MYLAGNGELTRGQVAERAVRTMVIVIPTPRFDDGFRVVQRCELMHVETLVAQAAVERFDVGVIRRFSGPREIELQAAIERPRFEGFRHELRAVIDGDRNG